MFGWFCVLPSLTSVSTLLWMATARRESVTWGGRSTWWKRWRRCSSAWSPSAVTSSGKSETFCAFPVGNGLFSARHPVDGWTVCVTRLRPQDTEQRARLWKHLQSLLQTYGHLRENDQSFLVEVQHSFQADIFAKDVINLSVSQWRTPIVNLVFTCLWYIQLLVMFEFSFSSFVMYLGFSFHQSYRFCTLVFFMFLVGIVYWVTVFLSEALTVLYALHLGCGNVNH